ncbi:MAG: BrnT family toxin [Phycisphaerae bacterium]
MYELRWNHWNVVHIGEHGVSPPEAEYVVQHARAPYPEYRGDGKYLVVGQGPEGTYLQVVFVVDPEDQVYVIHARPLTENEKRRYRRRRT